MAVFTENVTPKTKIVRRILSNPVTRRQKLSKTNSFAAFEIGVI